MLASEEPRPQPQPAPQGDSRGRIAAAVVLLGLAALGLTADVVVSTATDAGRDQLRTHQARMDLFQGRVVLELTYYLEGLESDRSLALRQRKAAGRFARMGVQSAAAYFQRAAQGLQDPQEHTAAIASAAALYAHGGDTMRALRVLQGSLDIGRRDVLSLLAQLYANNRLTREWLGSEAAAWIPQRVPAHLLIESQIAVSGGRVQRDLELRRSMFEAGVRLVKRVGALMAGLIALMLLGVGVLLWAILRRAGFGPYHGLPERPWGVWAGLELVGAWLVLSMLVAGVTIAFAHRLGTTGIIAAILASYIAASALALWWFAAAAAPPGTGLRTAGWRRLSVAKSIAHGIGAYAAALPLAMAAVVVASRLLPAPPVNLLVAEMTRAHGLAARALLLVLLCVAAPVVEETVFRGALYGGMRKRWTMPVAALASAVVFALVHLNWVSFVPVLVLGVALCVVYERTGSLLPGMVAHSLFNFATAVALFVL